MSGTKEKAADTADVGREEKHKAEPFTTINYVLFAVGLAIIVAGWFLLRSGSITLAPILLVAGYCGIIPLAIVYKKKHSG